MSTTPSNYSFPRIDIPKSEKENEEYHRQFGIAIINDSIDQSYDINYKAMHESVLFFDGTQGGEEFEFVQKADDGEFLPANWITFNRIRTKLEILFGELQAKGYQIKATSINKDAKSRKLAIKEESRVNMRLAPARIKLEQDIGVPLTPDGFVPENEEELDAFYKYNFKEKNEVIMEYALRFLAKKHNWSYTRLAAFRDLMIMGRCFMITEMKDGLPYTRRIDPRFMIFDTNASDDFLSDSTYFGEVRYMSIVDAASKYNLTTKEITDVYSDWTQFQKQSSAMIDRSRFFGLDGSGLKYFKGQGSDLRVLIVSAMWQDQEQLTHRETEDSYGGEHIKQVSDTATKGKLIKNTIAQWRKVTILGGDIVKDWGIIENSVRENDALAETSCPIIGLIPNYLNGKGISKVDQIKGLQKLKDLAMYNVQLEMTTAGRKGFIYDVSQTPDGWDIHTVMKYLKTAGIGFIDSRKDGIASTHNQFQKIDQTIGESVNHFMSIAIMMDEQMDAITGINDARQGQLVGAGQGLGVTQSALMQSNMATKMYDDLFKMFNEKALNYQAGLVKLSFAGNEKYAPIIGDVGIDFLQQTIDLELDDFGIFMEDVPPLVEDLNSFREIVMAALQTGGLDFVDGANLLIEKDVRRGIERLESAQNQRSADAAKAAEAEGQRLAAEKQGEQQGKESLEGMKGDFGMQKQQLVNTGDINEIVTKGRIDAGAQRVDVANDQKLATLKANEVARRDTIIK